MPWTRGCWYLGVDDIGDVAGGEKRHAHILQQLRQRCFPFFFWVLHPVDNCLKNRLFRVHLERGDTHRSDRRAIQQLPVEQTASGLLMLLRASKRAGHLQLVCYGNSCEHIYKHWLQALIFSFLKLQLVFPYSWDQQLTVQVPLPYGTQQSQVGPSPQALRAQGKAATARGSHLEQGSLSCRLQSASIKVTRITSPF